MVKKHLEIERRWLLSNLPNAEILGAIGVERTDLTTVYIVSDPDLELRIRQQSGNGEITYSVVTKIGSGLMRQESPKLSASADLFNCYYITLGKPYLVKNHWEIPLGTSQKLEISRFTQPKLAQGRGLLLAEIEFESEKAAGQFSEEDLPIWLKPLVIKEVTDDPRYNGKNLAVHGRPDPE